jgi:hypothetical protein
LKTKQLQYTVHSTSHAASHTKATYTRGFDPVGDAEGRALEEVKEEDGELKLDL